MTIDAEDKKSCFIITPIGADNSEIRRHADGVIEEVIRPLLKGDYSKIEASHNSNKAGSITNEIINNIYEADLVIANLTYLNPNVMYEVALRHAVAKPIIHIVCGDITKDLPFDIKDYRTIFYKDDIMGTRELKTRLLAMIEEIDTAAEAKDNPVYNALRSKDIDNLIKKETVEDSPTALTNMMLKRLLDRMDRLERDTALRKNKAPNEDIEEDKIKTIRIIGEQVSKRRNEIIDFFENVTEIGKVYIDIVNENELACTMISEEEQNYIKESLRVLSDNLDAECRLRLSNGNGFRIVPTIDATRIG